MIGDYRLSQGDTTIIGGSLTVGIYSKTVLFQTGHAQFKQEFILPHAAGKCHILQPGLLSDAAGDLYAQRGNGLVETGTDQAGRLVPADATARFLPSVMRAVKPPLRATVS